MGVIGRAPANAPLTTADISDGIIVGADIANGTITNDKLAIGYLNPDATDNLTVGYTTDIYVYTAGSTLTPDTTQPVIGTMSVTGNLTINEITDGNEGSVTVYLTTDASGPYTVTLGTGVSRVGTIPDLLASTTYKCVIDKVSNDLTVVQIAEVV